MAQIFISYRRKDSIEIAGRIYDRLEAAFPGQVFRDLDSIPVGVDFREYLDRQVSRARVTLALIGEGWVTAVDEHGKRRLDDPDDFVRIELESSLARGVVIIPVLIGGVAPLREEDLPDSLKRLVWINAAVLDVGRDFSTHMDRLIGAVRALLQGEESPADEILRHGMAPDAAASARESVYVRRYAPWALGASVLLAALYFGAGREWPKGPAAPQPQTSQPPEAHKSTSPPEHTDDPATLFSLALQYANGQGVDKDEAAAARLYRRAADLGDARAMNNLGMMYQLGQGGLTADDAEALRWWRKAANLGHDRAMTNLGAMYRRGQGGLTRNDAEAVRWYRKAANLGDALAMNKLGTMYKLGLGGLPKDDVKAVQWYRKGAGLGDARAMTNLGAMYRHGRGGLPKDEGEAARLYRQAADLGDALALRNVNAMGENGGGGGEPVE